MGDTSTSAICLPSLSPTLAEGVPVDIKPQTHHDPVWQESLRWQRISNRASDAEMVGAMAGQSFVRHVHRSADGTEHEIPLANANRPREKNRVLEIHGLMGSIGEQLMLAWAAEQDVQRVILTRNTRDEVVTRMLGRAHAELSAHFLLGASHSLANLALRTLFLDQVATDAFAAAWKNKKSFSIDFAPGPDERAGWLTMNEGMVKAMTTAAKASSGTSIKTLVSLIDTYRCGEGFSSLDNRRGMDYHRRRPQSVPHTAPKEGVWDEMQGHTVVKHVAPQLDPDADLAIVHVVAAKGLNQLAETMHGVCDQIPKVFAELGIPCVIDFAPWVESD